MKECRPLRGLGSSTCDRDPRAYAPWLGECRPSGAQQKACFNLALNALLSAAWEVSSAPTGRDSIAQVGAQRRPGISGRPNSVPLEPQRGETTSARAFVGRASTRHFHRSQVELWIDGIFRVVSRRVETRGSLPAAWRGRLTEAGMWRSRSGCAPAPRTHSARRDGTRSSESKVQSPKSKVREERRWGRGPVRTLSPSGRDLIIASKAPRTPRNAKPLSRNLLGALGAVVVKESFAFGCGTGHVVSPRNPGRKCPSPDSTVFDPEAQTRREHVAGRPSPARLSSPKSAAGRGEKVVVTVMVNYFQ
jgi:hypothetical protein